MNKTFMEKKENVKHNWYVIDANGLTLGRLATVAASLLRGKGKVTYTPNVNCGDYVVILNASKIKLTGNKWHDKLYRRHSAYNGGLKTQSAEEVMAKFPTRMVQEAVNGMLPHTKLGNQMRRMLFVYADDKNPHTAQKPVEYKVEA